MSSVTQAGILIVGGCVLYHYLCCREHRVKHAREDITPHAPEDASVASYNWLMVNNLEDPSVYDTEVKHL
jgi:hypothetical protein